MSARPSTRAGATGHPGGHSPHAENGRGESMAEDVSAESRPEAPAPPGTVGEEAVPLRPEAERRAEREREERLHVMTTRTRRRPSLPGHRPMLAALAAAAIVALVAAVVMASGGGSVSPRPRATVTTTARTGPHARATALPHGNLGTPARRQARKKAERRGRVKKRDAERRRSPSRHRTGRHREAEPPAAEPPPPPAPAEVSAATPEVEVTNPPAAAPVIEPTPEPEPEPTPPPEPTSKEASKPSEPPEAQVEGQFGFER